MFILVVFHADVLNTTPFFVVVGRTQCTQYMFIYAMRHEDVLSIMGGLSGEGIYTMDNTWCY